MDFIIPYKPREIFRDYHDSMQRWRVIVAHRRAGKTVACVNELIKAMVMCDKPSPRVAYIAPLLKQAKDTAWLYAQRYTEGLPDRKINATELSVTIYGDRRIRLYGADDPNSIRGLYLDAVIIDEFAQIRPRFLNEVLLPMLMDRHGRVTIIGTPMGRNEFFEIYDDATHGFWSDPDARMGTRTKNPDYRSWMFKASETGILDPYELESYRNKVSPNQYMQEMECSFDAAIEGSYYGALIEQAEREGRVESVPWRHDLPVYTSWDLGVGDDTSIWFCQRVGAHLHFIDHYAQYGQGASHYVEVLRDRGYTYAQHFLPHDSYSAEWGAGLKRVDTLQRLGLRNIKILPRVPPDDGINAVRALLPTMRFDKVRCSGGLEALRQYRRDYDEKKRCYRNTPLHDWTSHDADSMRYMCIGLEPEASPVRIPRYDQKQRNRWLTGPRWPSPKSWMSG